MAGQDRPDSGISHLVNKGGGGGVIWFLKLVFLGKKKQSKDAKALWKAPRSPGLPPACLAVHSGCRGSAPPQQVQSLAMHVCKRSPPRPPWDTLVQNALPGPPGAQGELRIHSHLINIIEVLPRVLAFLTQNKGQRLRTLC